MNAILYIFSLFSTELENNKFSSFVGFLVYVLFSQYKGLHLNEEQDKVLQTLDVF